MAVHNRLMALVFSGYGGQQSRRVWHAAAAGGSAAGAGALLLQLLPQLRLELFAAGAARLGAIFTGAGLERGDTGWLIGLSERTVAVTAACSGTDFFLMVAALIAWRLR